MTWTVLAALAVNVQRGEPATRLDIPFLESTPILDGRLDPALADLEPRDFPEFWQFDNPATDRIGVTYRMAYTATHLYLYIETAAEAVTFNRRGYLWGDGYKLLLAIPQSTPLTNEYYDLLFSPSQNDARGPDESIGAYNFGNSQGRLSAATNSKEQDLGDACGFEALIAWSDVPPYHPWFLDEMGYNIYFAKAVETWANGYAVVADEGIWDEELPKRNYAPLTFRAPSSIDEPIVLLRPARRNLRPGDQLALQSAAVGDTPSTAKFELSLSDAFGRQQARTALDVTVGQELRRGVHSWKIKDLSPGRYTLKISGPGEALESFALTVLPTIEADALRAEIEEHDQPLKIGVPNTLIFKLNQIANKLEELREYEPGLEILEAWRTFEEEFGAFAAGTNPYQGKRGPYRRAFRSKHDGTYQPYSLKLPDAYDPSKTYPLLVFMHGSGQDEQELLEQARSNGEFIELAPLARDIFRAYASDASQKDIVEAIEDVALHFRIDADHIVIGGFSMGGYGALRAYYEHPELYCAVAVFAGHPNLASEWLGEPHPNFLEDDYAAPFSGKPVFFYHGVEDPAVPVGLIQAASAKLQATGAHVTERIVPMRGHEYPDPETNAVYFDWLARVLEEH